jgi:hypothetical protein
MRRPSPALVVAVLALVVAFGGTAVAAKKYIITKTTQISPKVLTQLKKQGPAGPVGLTGPAGRDGAPGATGAQGPAGVASIVSITRPGTLGLAQAGVGTNVATLEALPAGAWMVVGSVVAASDALDDVTCLLLGQDTSTVQVTVPAGGRSQLVASAPLQLAQPASDVTLNCRHEAGGATVSVDHAHLYATRTGDLDRRTL